MRVQTWVEGRREGAIWRSLRREFQHGVGGGVVSCQCKGPEVGACLTFEEQ